MTQKERLTLIRNKIRNEKKVVVTELSKEYGVTEETIRRDLEKLENEGLVNRTYGGAVLNLEGMSEKLNYLKRAERNHEEKVKIGRLTEPFIMDNTTIGADASSTVMEALKLLDEHSHNTILTNSVEAIWKLNSVNIISTGGSINRETHSMQGSIVRKAMESYFVEVILISCTSLSMDGGIFDSNEEEADIKRALIERGQRIVLLADHTKFNRIAFVKLCDLDRVDILVTDEKPSQEWIDYLKERNVTLVYPD